MFEEGGRRGGRRVNEGGQPERQSSDISRPIVYSNEFTTNDHRRVTIDDDDDGNDEDDDDDDADDDIEWHQEKTDKISHDNDDQIDEFQW